MLKTKLINNIGCPFLLTHVYRRKPQRLKSALRLHVFQKVIICDIKGNLLARKS